MHAYLFWGLVESLGAGAAIYELARRTGRGIPASSRPILLAGFAAIKLTQNPK